MSYYFWNQGCVVDALLEGNAMLKRLSLQGKYANKHEVLEVINLLENLLLTAPIEAHNDKNARSVRTIIEVLQNIMRKDQFARMDMESQDLGSEEPSPRLSRRLSPSPSADDVQMSPAAATRSQDDFDSFAAARIKAIEDTIVTNSADFLSFKEIAGLDDAKTAMFEALVDPIRYPEYFETGDLKPWKSVLLYGPPGTGKTILSQAVVKEINGVLYQISSSDLISSWQGQSEKLIKELFDHAFKQNKTVVIFIDEVDSLFRTRSRNEDDANRRVKTELLVQIQRLQSSKGLILICATNCPWELDPAFLRRLEKRIYAGLPDSEARRQILKMKLKKTNFAPDVGLDFLAERSNGFSGDDLRRLASELAYAQFRKFKSTDGARASAITLSTADVHQVLDAFHPTVDSQQLALYEQFMSRR